MVSIFLKIRFLSENYIDKNMIVERDNRCVYCPFAKMAPVFIAAEYNIYFSNS